MKIRYGILGFGLHAVRRLMPGFANVEHCSLAGLWRRDQQLAAANALQYGATSFPTPEDLCASSEIDAIFVASPDSLHLEHTLLALGHGKAVLCEKPLAMNAAEARQMVDAAGRAALLLGVGHNYRFNRSLELIRDWIAAGRIGTPVLAHAQFSYPAQNSARKWITDPALANGGPIGDVGVHCIDALRLVTGRDVLSVSTLARTDSRSGAVEAFAALQMEMTGGLFANVTTSARTPYRTLVEVAGEDGVIVAENGLSVDAQIDVVLRRGGDVVDSASRNNFDSYTRMLDGFALALQGEASFPATAEDSWKNMLALDAAYRSWHSGQREQL